MTTNSPSLPAVPAPRPASRRMMLTAAALAVAMAATSGIGSTMKPTLHLSDTRPAVRLETMIPARFGDWEHVPQAQGVVNPQAQVMQDKLYSDLLNRVYRNSRGEMVLLSVAYGRDQSDAFQVHKPEICYPAQGFQVQRVRQQEMATPFGAVPVKRVETTRGSTRPEPVTYWTTLGDHAVRSGVDKKMQEMQYALKGYIADGLLFRMSSIDPDSEHAYAMQDRFAVDLLSALDPAARLRLAGLK
ncbi:exosortase-associated protein EpsI, B-type [Sphaerotilus uruguayifluvii]|uniref:EpsI family protein n=1 Tax=Sphaerotilus uruguayifluvii TaxID=2735897 RepID=A0ABX2G7N1_9BURK|nr:exosortase-associated protein EpsI, B-type [Leptothrix sp. C29]NRT58338.1 EpsI family protein [Leptothrix sp. C29]